MNMLGRLISNIEENISHPIEDGRIAGRLMRNPTAPKTLAGHLKLSDTLSTAGLRVQPFDYIV